jgi:hypothetical protein
VPLEAEAVMRTLTPHEEKAYWFARDLTTAAAHKTVPHKNPEKIQQAVFAVIRDVRRRDQSADPRVMDHLIDALHKAEGALVFAGHEEGAAKRYLHKAEAALAALSKVAILPDAPGAATKKAAQSKPKEPRVDRKLLEEYRQNFKEAQLSLDLRRPMNDRGWVQQRQPTKPMKIITGPDDRYFRLAIRDVDREDIERRDADAIQDWADGYRPPCPITKYVVNDDGPSSFDVQGFVQNRSGDWRPVGRLYAHLKELDDGTKAFVSESADVPIPTLAACPGLGNGMYLAAANEACRRRSRLAGSGYRSVFSEHFWKKQIEKERAYCVGGEASMYFSPSEKLRNALLDGDITVPQYNAMRGRLPKYPGESYWECEHVVLNVNFCKTRKKDRTLRGLHARGRYRIVSGRGQ